MYRDFEDLRDNCPAEIRADIAVDLAHADAAQLAAIWPRTEDGEFRLAVIQRVTDYWEKAIRERGAGSVPEDGFAIEILLDTYHDPEMGYSIYLDLHAYCGSEEIGELCWKAFDDAPLETTFCRQCAAEITDLLAKLAPEAGVKAEVEITEVEEL